jgi:hypothetical protein
MGQEIKCVAHFGGRSGQGEALLESTEILFRGEFRLKISFTSMKEVKAAAGELRVNTADGMAVFELGDQAEKWRDKILNPKSLVEKLGVKPGERIVLHGAVEKNFRESLKAHGAKIGGKTDSPWIFLGAEELGDLADVKKLARDLQGAAALWIVYPKGQERITESDVRSAGLKAGLTVVKVVCFSATHTALKLVIPKSKR